MGTDRRMILLGGASFIVAALAFVLVFGYLAANFNYPDILDGSAAEALPRLRESGSVMRAVWTIYAFLPLLLVPGAVAAWSACPSSRARMTLARILASLAALLAAFFLLSGFSMLDEGRYPQWLGWSGIGFSLLFLVGAFRNVTGAVRLVADVNNALLPVWLIVLGAALVW